MPPSPVLRLGTRGSDLALAQATLVEEALRAALPDVALERVVIRTTGDKRPDIRLADFARATADGPVLDKGIFTKELEEALRENRIDIAVHSLKDVPTEIDPAFRVAGVLPRAAVEDVLLARIPLGRGLDDLPSGARVATSSVRRQRLLLLMRPDLIVEEIRGNVPTRLRKLFESEAPQALVLARAGLERLGWKPGQGVVEIAEGILHSFVLEESLVLPAAGQGAVGLEIRAQDKNAASAVAAVNHEPTWRRVRLEREFLRLLQAGCHTPVGISTRLDGKVLSARAVVFEEGNPECRTGEARGPAGTPESIASDLLESLHPLDPPSP